MRNRVNLSGLFSLAVVGGYYLWRNREKVQSFMSQRGIEVPENLRGILRGRLGERMRERVGERISERRGVSREHETTSAQQGRRRAAGT